MSEIKLYKTQNRKDCLLIDGYRMLKCRVNEKGTFYWYCANKYCDEHCRSTMATSLINGEHVMKNPMTAHNHAPEPGKYLYQFY